MKALLINGSPRPHGCTYTALTELKKTLESEGIEVELIHVGNKDIRGCIACRKCHETGKCVFDDIVNEVAPKLAAADAFVIGAPVYFSSPAGGAISYEVSTDHGATWTAIQENHDVKFDTPQHQVAVRVHLKGTGTVLNKYFTMTGMPVASSQYWNMVYGGSAEEVQKDAEGLQTMRTLGRNMAFMMKSIQLGKAQFGLPQKEPATFTNFHH